MAVIQSRISEEEKKLVDYYSKFANISVSELIRTSVVASIEDQLDLVLYEQAIKEYEEDPTTYTHEQVKEMLGL